MFRRFWVYGVVAAAVLTLSPSRSSGASKEILELQRDVATLQDMVKAMQRTQDEKFSALQVLVQQSVNSANEASRAVAVIQSNMQQSLRDQESKVVTPVVGLSSRMDQMSTDMRTVQQAVSDLTNMISGLKSQLTDLNNAVKLINTPPAAPPPTGDTTGGGVPPRGSEAPPISSKDLYDNANRDRMGGKFDLALQEYADYLKWYGNTDLAPNAQYYIASIHASQGDYENAVKEYDLVVNAPDNNKIPDAMFGRGQALIKLGRRTDAGNQFRQLIQRFPRNDLSNKACDQLKSMGLGCAVPRAGAASPKGGTKKKK